MTSKVSKDHTTDNLVRKIKKASARAKQIKWDKYVGKIKLPDGLSYQQKMRDETLLNK